MDLLDHFSPKTGFVAIVEGMSEPWNDESIRDAPRADLVPREQWRKMPKYRQGQIMAHDSRDGMVPELAARGHDIEWKHGEGWGEKGRHQYWEGNCRNCGGNVTVGSGGSSCNSIGRNARDEDCTGPGTAWQNDLIIERRRDQIGKAVSDYGQNVKNEYDKAWLHGQGLTPDETGVTPGDRSWLHEHGIEGARREAVVEHFKAAAGDDSLDEVARRGYNTEDWKTWHQGRCGTYACALMRMNPKLRLGVSGWTEKGGGDASEGWREGHFYAHDGTHAYDSAGKHPLPYHGVHGDMDYHELGQDPADYGLPDEEAGPEGSEHWVSKAMEHARRHGILEGRYQRHEAAAAQPQPELEYYHLLQGRKMAHPFQSVMAAENRTVVGHLSWGPGNPDVQSLWVHPDYRHRGVATALWGHAQATDSPPQHSLDRSDAGDGWARTVTPGAPDRKYSTSTDEELEQRGRSTANILSGRLRTGTDRHITKIASTRPGRGEKQCPCCGGDGGHGDGSECDPCDGQGVVHSNEPDRYCPGQPQPRRRHWREGATAHEYSAGRMLVSDIRRPGEGRLSEREYTQDELTADVRRNGVRQPLAIEDFPVHGGPTTFNGMHRLDAAERAGVRDVPVVVRHRAGMPPPMTEHRPSTEEEFNAAYDLERAGRWRGEPEDVSKENVSTQGHTAAMDGPPASGRESVQHILTHYRPTDFDTWDEVRDNHYWHHPKMQAFVEDVQAAGVQRPVPIDYTQDPPRVMNGHTRVLAAERAGLDDVPVRQHEGFMDPDDPDPQGCHHSIEEHDQDAGRTAAVQHEAAGVDDYGMGHRPLRDGAPAHDLTEGYQEDIYTHPQHWTMDGGPLREKEREGYDQLRAARGNPDHPVHIYRAVPPGTPHRFHTGDWVSLSRAYAQSHADTEGWQDADAGTPWEVHHAVVPARHVRDAGTAQYAEQGYWGPDIDAEGPGVGHREAASPEEYGISHRPDTDGPPLHDLLQGGMMPRDFYDRMHEYNLYSHDSGLQGEDAWKAMGKIRRFRGQPEKNVRIWRGAPAVNPESRNAKRGEINHGDWIGLSREKAIVESREVNDPPDGSLSADHPNRYHVWSAMVPAKHVRNPDGDLTEWAYAGPDLKDLPHSSERCDHRPRVQPVQHPYKEASVSSGEPPEVEFRTARGKRRGIAHETVTAYVGGQKAGHARMIDGGRNLDDLWVEPGQRGQGIGHALMNEVVSRYGHQTLALYASPFTQGRKAQHGLDRDALQRFYESHGFERGQSDDGSNYMERKPPAPEPGHGVIAHFEAAASQQEEPGEEPGEEPAKFDATAWDAAQWPDRLRMLRYRKRSDPQIHRGMAIELPPEVHGLVHDQFQTRDRQAQAIADHLRSTGLGMHWSTGLDAPRHFMNYEHKRRPGTTKVILHAEVPDLEHIETDREKLAAGGTMSYDGPFSSEKEVPLKDGAPVRVTGVTWYGYRNKKYHGYVHTFGEPHTAGKRAEEEPEIEVVAHFEEEPHEDAHFGDTMPADPQVPYMKPPGAGAETTEHILQYHTGPGHPTNLSREDLGLHGNDRHWQHWHDSEHRGRTHDTHQHLGPVGTEGEQHWPDTFELSEHYLHSNITGERPGPWRPDRYEGFRPLRPAEGSMGEPPGPEPAVVAHFAANQEGAQLPVLTTSQFPPASVGPTKTREDQSGDFLRSLIRGDGELPGKIPARGYDDERRREIEPGIRAAEEHWQKLNDEGRAPEEGGRVYSPEEVKNDPEGTAQSIADKLLSSPEEFYRRREHGDVIQDGNPRLNTGGTAEGWLRAKWHMANDPTRPLQPEGRNRLRRWIRTRWEGKVGNPVCHHLSCPPWEHRDSRTAALQDELLGHFAAAALNGPDELPPDPGTAPIPEGHVRLWHYTPLGNVPSIRETGLERKYARGDSGTGDLSEPSAGVWASTKRPDELLNSHDSAKGVVEFHAHPDEISGNAESPWQAQNKDRSYDPAKLAEWAQGYHHVIMRGDVPKQNIVAVHEPWHAAARYMRDDPKGPASYQWVKDDYSAGGNDHLEPYIRGLRALEGRQHPKEAAMGPPRPEREERWNPRDGLRPDAECPHCGASADGAEQLHLPVGGGETRPSHLANCQGCGEIYDASKSGHQARLDRELADLAWKAHNRDRDAGDRLFAHVTSNPTHPWFGWHEAPEKLRQAEHGSDAVLGITGLPVNEKTETGKRMLDARQERALTHSKPFDPGGLPEDPRRLASRQDDPYVVYHGTHHDNAGSIQEHGLERRGDDWTVTTSREGAGIHAGLGDWTEPKVVEIHIPRDQVGDYLGEPFEATEGTVHALRRPIPAGMIKAVHTASVQATAALENPYTGHGVWYHGTQAHPEDIKQHGLISAAAEMAIGQFQTPDSETDDSGHWNAMLGVHFTADHAIAQEFARGEHEGSTNEGYGDEDERHEGVIHAHVHLKNPKVYGSEHDLDHEAYEHEFAAGNHPSNHHPGLGREGDPDEDDELADAEEMWPHAHRIAKDYGHGEIPAGTYGHYMTPFEHHPMRTAWLNTHPDKYGIAERHKQRLMAAGHDGIVYRNEYERSNRGGAANTSIVAFHPDRQIEITQHHHVDEPHSPDPEPREHLATLASLEPAPEVVRHFAATIAPMNQQLKMFTVPHHHKPCPECGWHPGERDPEVTLEHRVHVSPDGYEPAECEHCGGDMNFGRKHAEQHTDWLRDQDWYTDWNEEHPGDTLHRGTDIQLPPEVHAVVHDQTRPVHERAQALMGHMLSGKNLGGNGLGNFWSSDPDVSKTYAETAQHRFGHPGTEHTPVMFHIHTPDTSHFETAPDTLQEWGVYSYHRAGNREVPLERGTPLRIKGISWAPPDHHPEGPHHTDPKWHDPGPHRFDQDPAWTHHDIPGEGIRATASGPLSSDHPGEDVVAHFAAASGQYVPPPSGGQMWPHLQEAHGVSAQPGGKTPGEAFTVHLHSQFHSGQTADRRLIQHHHEAPAPGAPADDYISHFFTPAPAKPAKPPKPEPERLDENEYTLGDVSRRYDWEGFDKHEVEHLVAQPEHATFTREDVPVHSLRAWHPDGRLRKPITYKGIARQGKDERDRLDEVERGMDQGATPPIVVVRDGPHHIIADGSHRSAIARERGHSHIEAFVTDRTKHDGEHTAAVEAPSFRYDYETYGTAAEGGGFVSRSEVVHGPFYHGGRAKNLRPGDMITPGRQPNPWGDTFDHGGRSVHTYFAHEPETAVTYARQTKGHLYEVKPTGDVEYDGSGGDGAWRSEHPLEVVRRIPEQEWDSLPSGHIRREASVPPPHPEMVVAEMVADTATAAGPSDDIAAWRPEEPSDCRGLLVDLQGFHSASAEALEALAGRLDDSPLADRFGETLRKMASSCRAAEDDVAGALGRLDAAEGVWEPSPESGPKA